MLWNQRENTPEAAASRARLGLEPRPEERAQAAITSRTDGTRSRHSHSSKDRHTWICASERQMCNRSARDPRVLMACCIHNPPEIRDCSTWNILEFHGFELRHKLASNNGLEVTEAALPFIDSNETTTTHCNCYAGF
ncbi:hypothetical protein HPB50_006203 [Hyalomma asiaticum]|uniref:Uncharacterized protein n=1 Tax=Hyalomma asiaticum TaxID=266040 RepID=A0ACB7TFU4_HYAAI|nr:hypothetical protein HPB50_006203 [Hyalomma asiaticum]